MNCINCGAPSQAKKCAYCGTMMKIDKISSAFNQTGQTVGNQINISDSVGIAIGNNVRISVNGDFVGRDKIVYGKTIDGGKVDGKTYRKVIIHEK